MSSAVGIDLGTTNTVVAAVREGVSGTIPDPQGHRLLPSVVSFRESDSVLVGRAAVERRLLDPANTVYSFKRLMGLPWGSEAVQQARAKLPFELREGAHSDPLVVAGGETYSLAEISAFVLRHAKAVAEAALGAPVTRAVVTVPANFNDLQRAATKTAGRLAGLEVLRILNEPTAAALAYGPPAGPSERIAVYDLGGGTFDITLLDLAGNVFEVLSTAGDTALGGDDVDLVIAERMADDLWKTHHFDARADPAVFNRLRVLAEHLKRELSTREEHTVSVDDLAGASRGQMPAWRFRMTRAQIEAASLALIERTFAVCGQALAAASAQPRELDRIILVGGATRMPIVSRKVAEFFGRPAIVRINPDEVVALGAAIQATLLDRSRPKDGRAMAHPRVEVTSVIEPSPSAVSLPLVVAAASVSAATRGFDPSSLESSAAAAAQFLPGPTSKPLVFEVPRELASPSAGRARVPPPLPARGRARPPPPLPEGAPSPIPRAALPVEPQLAPPPTPRAAPVVPPSPPLLLIDVTPLDLGVETAGGFADVLIDANTPVPCDRTRAFATASDQQTLVTIRVAQGRSKRFAENTFLGELELTEIPPAPRGEMQIAVTFEIDVDGILKVRARDVKTGRETAARLQLIGAQTEPSEIEAMQARQLARSIAPVVRRG